MCCCKSIKQEKLGIIYLGLSVLSILITSDLLAATLPELPRNLIDTTFSLPTGMVINVSSGDDFQGALDRAELGDIIVLEAGATFQGPFVLPEKANGSGWIYVISSEYGKLPKPGARVSLVDAQNMPTIAIKSGHGAAVAAANNAHHFRFVGIKFSPLVENFIFTLVSIAGDDHNSEETLPEHIVFDRCCFLSEPKVGGRRAISMNGKSISIIDSYIAGFYHAGFDSQGIWVNNTPGPIKIVNNYIEGGAENFMAGGAPPTIQNVIPSDIEIRRNHFYKPKQWQNIKGIVKNLFELKVGRRVLVEGNIFENNWVDAQSGFAILFSPRSEDGSAPWNSVRDITFRFNVIKNTDSGFNMTAGDSNSRSERTIRILIEHNLLINIPKRVFQQGTGVENSNYCGIESLIIRNNTLIVKSGDPELLGMSFGAYKHENFVFENNLLVNGLYGFRGDGTGEGINTLNKYFNEPIFRNNVIIGGSKSIYPPMNYFPSSVVDIVFKDYVGGDYRLESNSPYKNAGVDGNDLGAEIDAIEGSITGICNGSDCLTSKHDFIKMQ